MQTVPLTILLACALGTATAVAQEPGRLQITIRDHRFVPAELHAPANQTIVIDVHNEDATAEEFESTEFGVEKVIAAGRQSPVRIRPLAPGRYKFIGEYHADTASGTLVIDGAQ